MTLIIDRQCQDEPARQISGWLVQKLLTQRHTHSGWIALRGPLIGGQ